jgi:hypothetical protein
MPFQAARDRCAAMLTAAGVESVTTDPVAAPPCVLVGLPEEIVSKGRAGWEFTLPVWIISPAPGGLDAAAWLLTQLPKVLDTLRGSSAEPDTFEVSGKECPAYRVEHNVTIDNPNC